MFEDRSRCYRYGEHQRKEDQRLKPSVTDLMRRGRWDVQIAVGGQPARKLVDLHLRRAADDVNDAILGVKRARGFALARREYAILRDRCADTYQSGLCNR